MANIQYYDVILKPVITEKSMSVKQLRQRKRSYSLQKIQQTSRSSQDCKKQLHET